MKVYYVSSGLQGCYYVRCLLPMQANGWDGDQTSPIPGQKNSEMKAWAAQNSDVVVFHRPDDVKKLELAKILKKEHGKKIVFDNDDTYKDDGGFKLNEFMDKERMDRGLKKINATIDEFISEVADVVTCSTDFLNKEYSKLHDNVWTLPNCVDPWMVEEPEYNETDVLRVGVTGSIGVTADFDRLIPIVKHFEDDKRIRFVLLSLPPRQYSKITEELYSEEYRILDSLDIEWHHFVPQHLYLEKVNSLKLDVSIIPRADNYFNRCKSNLKFLENSMLHIPTIAQTFPTGDSPYQQNPEDAKHLLLADNTEQFIAHLEDMIADRQKARDLGTDAYKYVIDNYDIEKHAHRWEEAYASAYNRAK